MPPAALAQICAELPWQASALLGLAVGLGLIVTVPLPLPVQPLESVTVTLNVPDVPELMHELVAPLLQA